MGRPRDRSRRRRQHARRDRTLRCARAGREGPRLRLGRPGIWPPGARLRAAFRRRRARLHEPLPCTCRPRWTGSRASSSTSRSASSCAASTAPPTSPKTAAASADRAGAGGSPRSAPTNVAGGCIGILPATSSLCISSHRRQKKDPHEHARRHPAARGADPRHPAAPGCRVARAGGGAFDAGSHRRTPGRRDVPPAARRSALARVLPAVVAGAGAAGAVVHADPSHRADLDQWPAHRAGGSARRDRRRGRCQRREPGGGAEERVRRQRVAGRGAAHQLARRQPGAERHRQRRDQAPEGQAPQEGLRGGGRDVRIGRLLHRGGGRRDLRRQGQHRRQQSAC